MIKTVMILVVVYTVSVQGAITNVTGWNSEAGVVPASIGTPAYLLDDMRVTEPGDGMRVRTAPPVPAPGTFLLTGLGTCIVGTLRYRRSL
jgi:hypothetical protein